MSYPFTETLESPLPTGTTCGPIGLDPCLIDYLFPFHLVFDPQRRVVQVGASLTKLLPSLTPGSQLDDIARVVTPIGANLDPDSIRPHLHTVFFVELTVDDCTPLLLKGQMLEQQGDSVSYLFFLGSPVVRRLDDLHSLGLQLNDFAVHDSLLDLLILLEAKERAIKDERALAHRLTDEINSRRATEKALRDSEAMLIRAQQIASLGHWQWDIDRDEIYWSDEMRTIFGIDEATPFNTLRHFLERVVEEDRPLIYMANETMLRHRRGTDRIEFRIQRPNGEIREVWGQSSVTITGDGKAIAHGIIQDITASKQVENQLRQRTDELEELRTALESKVESRTYALRQANQKLEQINQQKSQLVSVVSHELRSPLTSIKSFTELVRDDIEDGEYDNETHCNYLNIVNSETDRLARLINDLLDLQRIDANRMVWRDEEFDPCVLANSVASFFAQPFADKGLSIHIIPPNRPLSLIGDVDRFKQVFTNLITNAHNYIDQGGITISLEEIPLSGLALYVSKNPALEQQLDPLLLGFGFDLISSNECPLQRRTCPMLTSAVERNDTALVLLPSPGDEERTEALLYRLALLDNPPKVYLLGEGNLPGISNRFAGLAERVNPNDHCPTANCQLMERDVLMLRQRMERGKVLISIDDTGPGIPEQQLGRIFERFHQTGERGHGNRGSGLGLAICREIIDHYRGRIWCESRRGEGSRFRFTVPRRYFKPKPLGAILTESGAITHGQLEQALRLQRFLPLPPDTTENVS